MKLLVCIVPKSMVDAVTGIIGQGTVDYQIGFPVEGTAQSEILDYFSLRPTDRQMILSLIQAKDIEGIFERFKNELHFLDRGSGVAFTVSLNSIPKNDYQYLLGQQGENRHGKN